MEPRVEIRSVLERARAGTEELLEPVPEDDLVRPIAEAEPLVLEIAHAAHFEELWLLQTVVGDPLLPGHDDVREALANAQNGRGRSPALRADAVRSYAAAVRERTLWAVEHVDLDAPDPLLRHHFVFGLVVQNELQHQEAILQTLQLCSDREYPLPKLEPADRAPSGPNEVHVPAGSFVRGAVDEPWAYDTNSRRTKSSWTRSGSTVLR